jgi:hypothetical protein
MTLDILSSVLIKIDLRLSHSRRPCVAMRPKRLTGAVVAWVNVGRSRLRRWAPIAAKIKG